MLFFYSEFSKDLQYMLLTLFHCFFYFNYLLAMFCEACFSGVTLKWRFPAVYKGLLQLIFVSYRSAMVTAVHTVIRHIFGRRDFVTHRIVSSQWSVPLKKRIYHLLCYIKKSQKKSGGWWYGLVDGAESDLFTLTSLIHSSGTRGHRAGADHRRTPLPEGPWGKGALSRCKGALKGSYW